MAKKQAGSKAKAPVETENQSLGDYLNSIRAIRRMTLREVEEASGKTVSNAYLSQLEKHKISKPSPNILRSLAEVYVVPYDTLMEKAGYYSPSVTQNDALRGAAELRSARGQTFASANLTQEEEESLIEYLAFLRARKAAKKT